MGLVTTKSVLIWVVIVALLVGVIGFISGGFTKKDISDWGRTRNPENLLDYTFPVEEKLFSGLVMKIDEYGVIRIKGELKEQLTSSGAPRYIQWSYELGKVLLSAGKYTLTCEGANNAAIVGQYKDASGKVVDWVSDSNKKTLVFDEATEVTFSARIFKSGPINLTLYPILNKGANPINYYVTKTIGN